MVAVLAIAAAATGPVRGQNQQLTVYDVSSSTNVTPINGGYASQFNKCEMVYPASELAAMNGSVIKGLTFYSSTEFGSASWGAAQFQVFLREVADATISSYYGTTGATVVYEGSLSFSGDQMTVTFSTPYTYQGGNLLVGVYQPVIGTDATVYWYADVVTGACLGGRNANSLDEVTASVRDWLPKTTFSYGPAPQPHTVRFASGNDGWTVTDVDSARSATAPAVLQNVMAGDSLVVTAPATLPGKVKSVKAVKYVAPAATVTTAPTATAGIIEAGTTTALVNAGAANGGTMMYAVTSTNAQPASTADFSATRPTAQGRTPGTYYVWFYAKADADHSDSEIAGPVSVTLPVITTVTINQSDWGESGKSFTKDGVTVSVGNIDRGSGNLQGGGTFSTTLGNFTRIVVTTGSCEASGTGWSGSYSSMTWAGTPASTVSFNGNFMGMGMVQTTIVCTIVPTN